MYMKDPYRDDHQAVTVAYSLLVSFDKEANPLSISGLPSLPSVRIMKIIILTKLINNEINTPL